MREETRDIEAGETRSIWWKEPAQSNGNTISLSHSVTRKSEYGEANNGNDSKYHTARDSAQLEIALTPIAKQLARGEE
jgi:hypothetical protein